MDHHWEEFNSMGLEDRKCVYTWSGETYRNTEFIKHMIYTKFYIHPRNDFYDSLEHEFDFRKFGNKIYGTDETFYLLKIKYFDDWLGQFQHVQEPDDNRYSTTVNMADRYAHNDKPLHVCDSIINPTQFEVIERVNVRMYKTNQLGFSFSRTI